MQEEGLEVLADDGVNGSAEGGEGVERGLREDGLVGLDGRAVAEARVLGEELQVEGVGADGDGGAGRAAVCVGDDAKGDVVEGEGRGGGYGVPGCERRHCSDVVY